MKLKSLRCVESCSRRDFPFLFLMLRQPPCLYRQVGRFKQGPLEPDLHTKLCFWDACSGLRACAWRAAVLSCAKLCQVVPAILGGLDRQRELVARAPVSTIREVRDRLSIFVIMKAEQGRPSL